MPSSPFEVIRARCVPSEIPSPKPPCRALRAGTGAAMQQGSAAATEKQDPRRIGFESRKTGSVSSAQSEAGVRKANRMARARIVLGNNSLAKYPDGGGHWTWFLQFALGLAALGQDIFVIEALLSSGDEGED